MEKNPHCFLLFKEELIELYIYIYILCGFKYRSHCASILGDNPIELWPKWKPSRQTTHRWGGEMIKVSFECFKSEFVQFLTLYSCRLSKELWTREIVFARWSGHSGVRRAFYPRMQCRWAVQIRSVPQRHRILLVRESGLGAAHPGHFWQVGRLLCVCLCV